MRTVALLVTGFAAAACIGQAREAYAAWQRINAISCFAREDQFSSSVGGTNNPHGLSEIESGGAFPRSADCDIREDSTFLKQNINTLNVHGEDRHSSQQATAYACIVYWGADGGECGTPSSSGNSYLGPYTLTPGLSKFTSAYANDFGRVVVYVPSYNSTNGYSTFRGMYLTTP